MDDLGHDALTIVLHPLAQSLANGLHLLARGARFSEQKNGAADFNLLADPRDQVDAERFNICAHRARRDYFQTERCGVRGDLLAFDQTELAAAGLAGRLADAAKVAWLAFDAFPRDHVNEIDRFQRHAGFGRVQVKRDDTTDKFL